MLLRSGFALFVVGFIGALASAQTQFGPQPAAPARPAAAQAAAPTGAPGNFGPVANNSTPRAFAPAAPAQPAWIPLPADHEKYLNDVLTYWESRSAKIERFRCSFTRWVYDPAFSQRDPATGEVLPHTEATGEIMYAAPDKGLIRIDVTKDYKPAQVAPGQPPKKGEYAPRLDEKGKTQAGEHWVSDGKSIFEFLHDRKELHRIDLPPDMQGQAITDGPLPFIFGAKAETLKQRYWFRVVTPATVKDQYWLEAWPKLQQDASNYLYVKVIIDQKEYLPLAVEMNDRDERRIGRRVYAFDNRKVNWNETLTKLFAADPFNPKTPGGYKLIVENVKPAPPAGGLDAGIDPKTARRPSPSPFPRKQ